MATVGIAFCLLGLATAIAAHFYRGLTRGSASRDLALECIGIGGVIVSFAGFILHIIYR